MGIRVDAYPNQPFQGRVLKIEPEALVEQNVTMFPVLIRIPNGQGLLRPGMNAEVEVHIGERQQVVAVPNNALRTQRDVGSAATVLGLEMSVVEEQLAAARPETNTRQLAGNLSDDDADQGTITFRGRTIELPQGLTRDQVTPVLQKIQAGGPQAFQSLSAAERSIMQRVMQAGGGGNRGRRGGEQSASGFQFGGNYIVFALRGGTITALPIRTGLTDLDYSEVVNGLSEGDTVLVLPSASLLRSQQEMQERIQRVTGGGLPGMGRRR